MKTFVNMSGSENEEYESKLNDASNIKPNWNDMFITNLNL